MSIYSYKDKVRRGVSNAGRPTCFPAALEQVSPDHSYPDWIYKYYPEFSRKWDRLSPKEQAQKAHEFGEMMSELFWPLGELTWEDAVFKRANTAIGFARLAGGLLAEGYRVVADVSYSGRTRTNGHSVGLLSTGERGYVALVSNQLPKYLHGIISLTQLGQHVILYDDPHLTAYPFHDSNITALPPVN